MKARRITGDIVVYLILAILVVVWLAPIVWLVLQSFGYEYGVSADTGMSLFVPRGFSFENYINIATNQVWTASSVYTVKTTSAYNFFGYMADGQIYLGSFTNTVIVALCVMVVSTLLTLMSAYGFSRLRFRGRQGMMRLILILGMFPGFLGLIILYWLFNQLGLTRSIWALIIVYSAGAGMGYYISKGFFDTISKQIDEAAMVDGATRFQIFYKITMPLSKPIVVYTALTAFMSPWGEYITSSYLLGGQLTTKNNWTVAIMLNAMITAGDGGGGVSRGQYWGQFCAGAVLVALPTALIFIVMQRYYVSGVTGGAVKG